MRKSDVICGGDWGIFSGVEALAGCVRSTYFGWVFLRAFAGSVSVSVLVDEGEGAV